MIGKEDKEELDIGNVDVGDAVMAGDNTTEGDPEGTVTSKDGKTRITNFEAHWVGTDEDTVLGTTLDGGGYRDKHPNYYLGKVIDHNNTKLQVKYVISGERLYEPGMIKIKLPYYSRAEGYPESYVKASNIPMPKAKIVDGKIDYNADYGKAEYIYYIDGDDLIVTNTTTIPAATSGTFLVDYLFPNVGAYRYVNVNDDFKSGVNDDIRNMPDMYKFEIGSQISIDVNNDEKITKDSHKLYHQVDKIIDGKIYKSVISINTDKKEDETEIFKNTYNEFYPDYGWDQKIHDWRPEWNEKMKPKNHEDYYYMIWDIRALVGSVYSNATLKIEDMLGENQGQQIIGYQIPDDNFGDPDKLSQTYSKQFKPYSEFSDKEAEFTFDKFGPTGYYGKDYSNCKHMLLLVAFKKDLLLDQKEHKFTNTGKITIKQLNSDDKPQTYTDNAKIDVKYVPLPPKAEFTAPPGNKFSLNKEIGSIYSGVESLDLEIINPTNKSYTKAIDLTRFYNGSEARAWKVGGVVEALAETYDPAFGEKDNLDAYGKKTYTAELVDDYLYTGNDYKRELTSEDYEINSVYLSTADYDYKRISRTEIGYVWGYKDSSIYGKDGITYPSKLYGRKESTGKWEEIASFDFVKTRDSGGKILNFTSPFDISKPKDGQINIPKGFTSVKWAIETNRPKLTMSMSIDATLKPSEYIQKMFKENETSLGNSKLRIRNDGTLRVINNKGEVIGIPSTTKRNEDNSRTLNLDLENYGQEMYHDTAYWDITIKTPENKVFEQNLEKYIGQFSSYRKVINDKSLKAFIVPAEVRFREKVKNDNGVSLRNYENGVFYDLLPLGVSGVENLKIYGYYPVQYNERNSTAYFKDKNKDKEDLLERRDYGWKCYYFNLNSNYELIENWQNTGRTLLIAKYDNAELVIPDKIKNSDKPYLGNAQSNLYLSYDMIYPWDSYKDYGGNLYNFVAFESGKESMESGLPDVPNFEEKTEHHKIANKALKDLNKDNDNKNFLYAMGKTTVSGNTSANTGLTKHIKDSKDPKYSLATKTREGGQYSYRIRMQSLSGTTTSNLIFYDSIENYNPLKTDEDYGVKRWRGALEHIDLTHARMKGADPKVYVSTLEGLNMQENKDITNTNVWKPYKEGDDLSKVQAIAVDLRHKPDGSEFKLKEEESVNITLNMRAPWNVKEHQIDPKAKALNEIYANTTITTDLNNQSTNKLINTAYTAIKLEPVSTEININATKKYLDKEDKNIALKGNDFTFELKDDKGKVLQTKANDAKGNITFDPIKYNSWDVGEYTYNIEEVKGNDNKIDYDKHIETVKVNVERVGDSELKATVVYDKDGSNFTNKEKKSASFQLVKLKSDQKEFGLEEIKDENGNLTSYKVPEAQKDNVLDDAEYKLYKLTEGKEELVATLITKNGISQVVQDIMPGKYKLKETKAPKGYTLNDKDLVFDITDKDAGTIVAKFATDDSIIDMPSTGGQGTKALMTGGGILVAVMAGVLIVANKKKKEELNK